MSLKWIRRVRKVTTGVVVNTSIRKMGIGMLKNMTTPMHKRMVILENISIFLQSIINAVCSSGVWCTISMRLKPIIILIIYRE